MSWELISAAYTSILSRECCFMNCCMNRPWHALVPTENLRRKQLVIQLMLWIGNCWTTFIDSWISAGWANHAKIKELINRPALVIPYHTWCSLGHILAYALNWCRQTGRIFNITPLFPLLVLEKLALESNQFLWPTISVLFCTYFHKLKEFFRNTLTYPHKTQTITRMKGLQGSLECQGPFIADPGSSINVDVSGATA